MPIDSLAELTVPESLHQRQQTAPSQELDRSSFMKLLVAELKNQDPLEPLEAREMVTQLSQLSAVERLASIEEGVAGVRAEMTGMASTQLSSLLGRMVTADASSLVLGSAGAASGVFEVPRQAASVEVTVRDGTGDVVRTLVLPNAPPGSHNFTWDGNDDGGKRLPPGRYAVDVAAEDEQGNRLNASTRLSGIVTEVSYGNGTPEVVVGTTRVLFNEVTSIAQ